MPWTLELWRQASRHQELSAFVEAVLPILRERLPVVGVVVYDAHPERSALDVAASEGPGAVTSPWMHRLHLSTSDRDAVATWAREPIRTVTSNPPVWLQPDEGCTHPAALLPLLDEDHCIGILVLLLVKDGAPNQEVLVALQEPFSVALRNHRRILELQKLREALEADREALLKRLERSDIAEAIVGSDRGLSIVMERVTQVAPTDSPVLLLGETGSGKEVIARAVHERSHRADGPMLRVNCGAIPTELVDAELFGHERGSFTGAVGQRRGWFERAHGGTLFLDEIGELPLAAQVRLLRVLQDGVFERVGGEKTLAADVRIVAATHRDLPSMVKAGRFREDLWFRLCVFPIDIPTLRARPEDIGDLAAHFAARAGRRLGGLPLSVSSHDVELLRTYSWPGNVRELAAVVERAAILGNGRRLEFEAAMGMHTRHPASPPASNTTANATTPPPSTGLNDMMRAHIITVLKETQGQIEGPGGAAARLDVNPHTLRSRMRKLSISWSEFRKS